MEEILASIRKIIADDQMLPLARGGNAEPAAAVADEAVKAEAAAPVKAPVAAPAPTAKPAFTRPVIEPAQIAEPAPRRHVEIEPKAPPPAPSRPPAVDRSADAGLGRHPRVQRGEAPARHLGRDRLVQEAVDILIPEAYNRAIEEQDVDAIGQPAKIGRAHV